MDRIKRIINLALRLIGFMLFSAAKVSATATTTPAPPATFMSTIRDVESILLKVGGALGTLVIAWESVIWITAQNPAERESAKKAIIYVMIGLLLLKSSENIIKFLLVTI